MAFTEAEYTDLLTWGGTTATTVLDSDGELKMALHNRVPNTDLSDTGDWTHENLTSVTESGTSPSGKAAYSLLETTDNGEHRIYDVVNWGVGNTYSHVLDVKANGRTDFTMILSSTRFGSAVRWEFDLDAVTVSQTVAGTNDSASITLISDGWYRCVMTADCTSDGNGTLALNITDGGTKSYAGDITKGLYLSRPRIYQSAVHAPVELVTNGDFATDSDWTKGTGWTIGSGVASKSAGSGAALAQSMALTSGKSYRIEYTVSNYSAGSCLFRFTGASTLNGTTRSADGTFVEIVTNPAANTTFDIYGDGSFAGDIDNVSVVEVKDDGMQLGSDGTDYLDTGDAGPLYTPGVAYDGNGACLGLQSFEARTNLQVYSNEFSNAVWTKSNSVVTQDETSPDGSVNAWTLTDASSTGTGNVNARDILTLAANTDYCWSIFAKADQLSELAIWVLADESDRTYFDLSAGTVLSEGTSHSDSGVEDYGNGWYRCWVVYQSTTDLTFDTRWSVASGESIEVDLDGTSSILIYGADVQVGSFPSPYIPTISAASSRGAGNIYKALSEFGYNQTEGTVVAICTTLENSLSWVYSLNDGSSDNRVSTYAGASGDASAVISVATVNQASIDSLYNITAGEEFSSSVAYKANDFAASVGGLTAVTDTSGSVPTVTELQVGAAAAAASPLNGYIKSLVYYPARLSDATLESESA